MPRKRNTRNTRNTGTSRFDRLARLPIVPELAIEGGVRPLEFALEDDDGSRPDAVLWVDTATGFVRASGVVTSTEDGTIASDEAINLFVAACVGPFAAPDPAILAYMGEIAARSGRRAAVVESEPSPQPGLPAVVRLEPGVLAEAIRALVDPLGVRVELVAEAGDLPRFNQAFDALATYLRNTLGGRPSEPFAWDIAQDVVAPLMKAASGLWRRAPWDFLPDHPPVAVRLGEYGPEPDVETVYASVLGGGGMVAGVALYFSVDEYRQALAQGGEMAEVDERVDEMIELMRQSGAPVEDVPSDILRGVVGEMLAQSGLTSAETLMPQQNTIAVMFGSADDEDPTYLDWLKARGLKYPSRRAVPSFLRTRAGVMPQPPSEREARAATLALEALMQFVGRFADAPAGPLVLSEPLTMQARVNAGGAQPVVVEVTFPPRDWDVAADLTAMHALDAPIPPIEEPEAPGSLEGARTVYRFKVTFEYAPDVWRRIEIRGDQTLHDLHNAIQDAFDWDDDHLYAFFLSGKAWDESTEYARPGGEGRSAARFRLEHLPLRARQRLLYIFDFGDELRHTVKLEAIERNGVATGASYPRTTETHGRSVPQYPDAEEWDDSEEGGENGEEEDGEDGDPTT